MELLQAITLGLIQGITEFIPVSSSGHLVLLPKLVGWQDQGLTFDVLLHGATLLALLVVFWQDIVRIVKGFFSRRKKDRLLGWWLILGSIPAALVGFLGSAWFERARIAPIVAFSLIFWGVLMWVADRVRDKCGVTIKKSEHLRWHHAFFVGLAQAIALIPGTSRSGITITAGLAAGMNRKESVRFSFLLGIPVFFGATLLKTVEAAQNGISASAAALLIGFVVAFLSGIFAIKFLLKFVESHHLTVFVWYRIVLGVLVLILL